MITCTFYKYPPGDSSSVHYFTGCGCGKWTCVMPPGQQSRKCRSNQPSCFGMSTSCDSYCLRCQAKISKQAVIVEAAVLWPADCAIPSFIRNIFDEEPPEFQNKSYSKMVSMFNSHRKSSKSGRGFQLEIDSTLPSAQDLVCNKFNLNIQKAHLRVLRTHSSGFQFWLHDQVDFF